MEVHHRVKNNLQVIASLLNLQGSRIRVPEAQAEFQAARDRVRALATLHRHLYADGELHTINMRSFLIGALRPTLLRRWAQNGRRPHYNWSIEAPETADLQRSGGAAGSLIVTGGRSPIR